MDVVVVRDPADLVNTNVPAQVSFTGAQALFLGQQRNYLTEAIREKVKKNYSNASRGVLVPCLLSQYP
jgi:hypothetical protein